MVSQKLKVGDKISDNVHKGGTKSQVVSSISQATVKSKLVNTVVIPTHTPIVNDDAIILQEAHHNGVNDFIVGQ